MTKIFKTPFGALGDKQEVPVSTQTDGSVSYEQGFGVDYQRDYEDPQAKDIPREKLNQLFYDMTKALGELQKFGYMQWQAGQYQAGDRVAEGGVAYKAIRTTTNKPPHADWVAIIEDATPVDQIFTFESELPPEGYIARNGQAIDSARMPKLYARYGANMPDDRNRVYRMRGDLTGVVGSTQEDSLKKHDHAIQTQYFDQAGELYAEKDYIRLYSGVRGDVLKYSETRTSEFGGEGETRVKSRIVIFCNKIQ